MSDSWHAIILWAIGAMLFYPACFTLPLTESGLEKRVQHWAKKDEDTGIVFAP